MKTNDKETFYEPPRVRAVEIDTRAVVCQSGGGSGITDMKIDEDGENIFE